MCVWCLCVRVCRGVEPKAEAGFLLGQQHLNALLTYVQLHCIKIDFATRYHRFGSFGSLTYRLLTLHLCERSPLCEPEVDPGGPCPPPRNVCHRMHSFSCFIFFQTEMFRGGCHSPRPTHAWRDPPLGEGTRDTHRYGRYGNNKGGSRVGAGNREPLGKSVGDVAKLSRVAFSFIIELPPPPAAGLRPLLMRSWVRPYTL